MTTGLALLSGAVVASYELYAIVIGPPGRSCCMFDDLRLMKRCCIRFPAVQHRKPIPVAPIFLIMVVNLGTIEAMSLLI